MIVQHSSDHRLSLNDYKLLLLAYHSYHTYIIGFYVKFSICFRAYATVAGALIIVPPCSKLCRSLNNYKQLLSAYHWYYSDMIEFFDDF